MPAHAVERYLWEFSEYGNQNTKGLPGLKKSYLILDIATIEQE